MASFEAPGERKDPFNACLGSTKDQAAPEGSRVLCRALRLTTGISHVLVSGSFVAAGTMPSEDVRARPETAKTSERTAPALRHSGSFTRSAGGSRPQVLRMLLRQRQRFVAVR